jgi:N-acetylmuramoyl-L-alanine amidase
VQPFHVVVLSFLVIVASCGTRSVDVAEPVSLGEDAASTDLTTSTSSSTSSTTSSSTTTTSTTTSTTTTTTTVPVSLGFDEEGVPVNGQTSGVVETTTGWVVPVLETLDDGWSVWTPCGRQTTISSGSFAPSVDFVIDPGHGGSETGAVGPAGTIEADLNLQVSRRVVAALEADGYSVLLTRDSDVRVPIVTRGEIALALDPIAFISIHHNAGTEELSGEPGTEMFFQLESPQSKRLAGLIFEESRAVLDPLGSSWFALGDAGAMARPNRQGGDYYGVLRRPAAVPSVLAEFAYITNPAEEELLNRADVQESLATAVREAVARFMATDDPGSGFTEDPIFRGYGPSGAGRTTNCTDPALE